MSKIVTFLPGGYGYIPNGFQYSSGVVALPGNEFVRVRFLRPVPLAEGFAAIESHLRAIGRPTTAFAHCELRSPRQMDEKGFTEFNREYIKTLERWGIYRDDTNPVARTNVCPLHDAPREVSMFAFTVSVPVAATARLTFMTAGGAEVRAGPGSFAERTVRYGDTSPEGMREKVRVVVDSMSRRLEALGVGWQDAVSAQLYTVHDIGHLVGPELSARGIGAGGLVWYYAKPPVLGLEFEMDVRGAARELLL